MDVFLEQFDECFCVRPGRAGGDFGLVELDNGYDVFGGGGDEKLVGVGCFGGGYRFFDDLKACVRGDLDYVPAGDGRQDFRPQRTGNKLFSVSVNGKKGTRRAFGNLPFFIN